MNMTPALDQQTKYQKIQNIALFFTIITIMKRKVFVKDYSKKQNKITL